MHVSNENSVPAIYIMVTSVKTLYNASKRETSGCALSDRLFSSEEKLYNYSVQPLYFVCFIRIMIVNIKVPRNTEKKQIITSTQVAMHEAGALSI